MAWHHVKKVWDKLFLLIGTAVVVAWGYGGATDASIARVEDYYRLPGVRVIEPFEGDIARPGGTYTVVFDYFDDRGEKLARFDIELYSVPDRSEVAVLCDKPESGCLDMAGDYDVLIPSWIPEGDYVICVCLHARRYLCDCSETFQVALDPGDVRESNDSYHPNDEWASFSYYFFVV